MSTIFIGLRSNIENRLEYLKNAILLLEEEMDIIKISSVYETPPWGLEDQPHFLNLVLKCHTHFDDAYSILKFVKKIEKELGREKTVKWGPRVIDIDILMLENRVYHSDKLTIPHKNMVHRGFVMKPLAEIAGELIHPVLNKSMIEIHDDLKDEEIELYHSQPFRK